MQGDLQSELEVKRLKVTNAYFIFVKLIAVIMKKYIAHQGDRHVELESDAFFKMLRIH